MLSHDMYKKLIYGSMIESETIGLFFNGEDGEKTGKMLSSLDLYDYDTNKNDIYFTLNYFRNLQSRKTYNVSRYRAFYIDIDAYHVGLSLDEAITNIEKIYGTKIPFPTLTIKSGQGAYLIWLIEPVGKEYGKTWSAIEKCLHKELEEYGSDKLSLDAPRVLRVPGSINAKPGANKEVIISEYNPDAIYTIDLFIEWFNIGKNKSSDSKTNKAKKSNTENKKKFKINKHLARLRATDIANLMLNRKKDLIGMRENGLFLYRLFLLQSGYTKKEALQMTLDLNANLHLPLSKKEVTSATNSANTLYYKYRDETIINMLNITDEEQADLMSIRNDKDRKKRRWEATGRIVSRADETQQKCDDILRLKNEGKNVKEICQIVGCSQSTCYAYLKNAKSNTANTTETEIKIVSSEKITSSTEQNTQKRFRVLSYIIYTDNSKNKNKQRVYNKKLIKLLKKKFIFEKVQKCS